MNVHMTQLSEKMASVDLWRFAFSPLPRWDEFHRFLGGFAFGDTSLYPSYNLVNRSLALGEPVIYVSANYRMNGIAEVY